MVAPQLTARKNNGNIVVVKLIIVTHFALREGV
jgi:hypothetical protein